MINSNTLCIKCGEKIGKHRYFYSMGRQVIHVNCAEPEETPMEDDEKPQKHRYSPIENQKVSTEGLKDDKEKPQWHLLPWEALREVVDVLTFGAKKYAPNNWRHVPDWQNRYLDAALRHIIARAQGQRVDPETQKPNIAHAVCCLLFILALDKES